MSSSVHDDPAVDPAAVPYPSDPATRFIGVHFMHWRVDLETALLLRMMGMSGGIPHPLLVVEERHRVHHVLDCCDLAASAGVRVRMTLSQAEASIDRAAVQAKTGDASARFISKLRSGIAAPPGAPGVLGGNAWADRLVALGERLMAIRWDPALGARALDRLGRCLERWIPVVSIGCPLLGNGTADASLLGDFTGCTELFRRKYSSEQKFMRRIGKGFGRLGFRTQLATASTIGAAAAMAKWGAATGSGKPVHAIPRGAERRMLGPLPIESLRVGISAAEALRSVEVETVEQLARLGRAGVAARLSGHLDDGRQRGRASRASSRASGRSGHVASITWGAIASSAAASPSLFGEPAPVTGSSRSTARKATSAVGTRAVDDVLMRLDQALGANAVAAEALVPIRTREPIVEQMQFEGPCIQLETILVATSGLLDRMVHRLHARREGLRAASLVLRHADLPADLSTDSACMHVASSPGRRTFRTARGAPMVPTEVPTETHIETHIELSVARPSLSRTHLWSVVRPRLESIALDHGVESIRCTVERSTRLRFRDFASLLPTVGGDARVQGGLPALSGMPAHVVASSGSVPNISSESAGSEWMDLVKGRLGRGAIIELPLKSDEIGACEDHSIVTHRPSVILARPEVATLRAGRCARCIAAAVATRALWRASEDPPDQDAGDVPAHAGGAGHPCCEWRGGTWRLQTIDGWERVAAPWWSTAQSMGPSTGQSTGQSHDAQHAGRVHARIEIGDGLWLFVRWPTCMARASSERSPSLLSAHRKRTAEFDPIEHWLDGGAAALRHGVVLDVLGAWA